MVGSSVAKLGLILPLLAILAALARALYCLVQGPQKTDSRLKALYWRVGLSIGVIVYLGVAYYLGWLTPHGLLET